MRIPIDTTTGQGETIMALNAAGLSARSIGRYIGRSGEGVIQWLRRRGLYRSPHMTDAETQRLRDLWADGWGVTEIAADLGRSVSGVDSYLRRTHLLTYSSRTSERTRAGIVDMYDRGMQIVAIADRYNVCTATVKHWRDAACRRKRRRLMTAVEADAMVALYADGEQINRIAEKTGRAESTVQAVLRRAGVHDPARVSLSRAPSDDHPWKRKYSYRSRYNEY